MFTFFRNLWNKLFGNNKILETIAVQEIALVLFKKHPETKAVIYDAISRTVAAVESGIVTSTINIGPIIKSKLDYNKLPDDQKPILIPAINQMVDSLCDEMDFNISSSKIVAPPAQLVEYLKMLKAVMEVAK